MLPWFPLVFDFNTKFGKIDVKILHTTASNTILPIRAIKTPVFQLVKMGAVEIIPI